MPELNSSIPHFYALLRSEYLYNLESHHGELVPCWVVGVTSIPSRAIGFHVITNRGAMFSRLPISALVWNEDSPEIPLDHLELWDCFSYHVSAFELDAMKGLRCRTRLKDCNWYYGDYMFTLDWHSSRFSEDPGEGGYKTAHIIKLDCGLFAAQPNNRVQWKEMSFITNPFMEDERPDYLALNQTFSAESGSAKWDHTEDTNRMDYSFSSEVKQ